MENLTGKKVMIDNGLEFYSEAFRSHCAKAGIQGHKTVRNTPQQKSVVERMNMNLLKKARCMMFNAGMAKSFWGEAIMIAAYLVNGSPSSIGIDLGLRKDLSLLASSGI